MRTKSYKCKLDQLIQGSDKYNDSNLPTLIDPNRIVYPDLVMTLDHKDGKEKYFRPLVQPNGSLHVVGNNTFYKACKQANIQEIYCDFIVDNYSPSELEETFNLEQIPKKEGKEIHSFIFFKHPNDVLATDKEELELVIDCYYPDNIVKVEPLPELSCIHYSIENPLLNQLEKVEYGFLRKTGGEIRSLNGVKPLL